MQQFKNQDKFDQLIQDYRNRNKTDGNSILETTNGVKIFVRHNVFDAKIVKEQFVDLQYFQFFDNSFKPKTVLDIGGYIGDLSLYCASNFNSKVHCYEPTPQNFSILEKNMHLNPHLLENIEFFNMGISHQDEHVKINVQDDVGEIHASMHKDFTHHQSTVEVECRSLLNAVELMNVDVIDYVKIDCEGHEFPILMNTNLEILANKINYLIFEHHKFVENYSSKINILIEQLEQHFTLLAKPKKLLLFKSKCHNDI